MSTVDSVLEFVAGQLVAVLAAVFLWLLLPRGVVLVKQNPVRDEITGDLLPDTWRVINSSALPIRVTSAEVLSLASLNPEQVETVHNVRLTFDDHVLAIRADEFATPWSKQLIPAGETVTATVGVNATLRIKYRRAGWAGVLERRELVIFGFA